MQDRPPEPRPKWQRVGGMLKRLESNEDYIFGTFDRVVIAVWRNETRGAAVNLLEHYIEQLAQEAGGKVVYLTVVEEKAAPPPADVRELTAAMLRRAPIELSAISIEGSGFRAAIVRGVVTGIGLLARGLHPHRTFAAIEQAADWIEAETTRGPNGIVGSLVLARAVHTLRLSGGGSAPAQRGP